MQKEARTSQVWLVVKNLPASAGDVRDAGSIPGSSRSPGGGRGNPLQRSCLEHPMGRGACGAPSTVSQSLTRLKHTGKRALGWESAVQLCDFGRATFPLGVSVFLCCLRRSWDLIHGFHTVLLSALAFPDVAQGPLHPVCVWGGGGCDRAWRKRPGERGQGGDSERERERGGEKEGDFGDSTQLSCSKQKHMTTETRWLDLNLRVCVCVLGEAGKRLLAGYLYLVIRKNRFSPDSRQLAIQRSPQARLWVLYVGQGEQKRGGWAEWRGCRVPSPLVVSVLWGIGLPFLAF